MVHGLVRWPKPRVRDCTIPPSMRVAIGADHAGFLLKEHLKQTLQRLGHAVDDHGTHSEAPSTIRRSAWRSGARSPMDGPIAASCSAAADRASRLPPTRCRVCARRSATICFTARLSREHNDANVLSMGGRIVAFGLADEILALWLDTPFAGGRHQRRIDQICAPSGRPTVAERGIRELKRTGNSTDDHRRRRQLCELGRDADKHEVRPAERSPEAIRKSRGDSLSGSPERRPGADRLGELRQPCRARSRRLGAHQQVRRGLSRQALLRRLRVRRRRRAAGDRAREAAVRRRARQRAAALRRPGQHGRLHDAAEAGRHGPRHEPGPRRPPDARASAQLLGPALHHRALRRAARKTERIDYDELDRPRRRAQAEDDHRRAPAPTPRRSTSPASAPPPIAVGASVFSRHGAHRRPGRRRTAPSPVPHADFVTTTTHKTLRGPRGGMVLCRQNTPRTSTARVFPGIQGGPLMHVIAAKAVCFDEALQPEFADYQQQIVANATAPGRGADRRGGFRLVSGGTDNHLMLVDVHPRRASPARWPKRRSTRPASPSTRTPSPSIREPPMVASGIRIGTPAVTTRGMREAEMDIVGELIARALARRPTTTRRWGWFGRKSNGCAGSSRCIRTR